MAIRLHITLDDQLVDELDRRLGPRERSAFIATALRKALEDERRWDDITEAIAAGGRSSDDGFDWGDDPAGWVRSQRRADERRVG